MMTSLKAAPRFGRPHPVTWFHGWEERVLVQTWTPIRFQPILFTFLFAGIVFVVARRPTLPAMSALAGTFTAYVWMVLALACPPLLLVSWLMIRFCTKRKTYLGYWLRFAADLGQTFSYIAWVFALVSDPDPETEDGYAQIVLGSILTFLVVLVIRDVLKLVLLERTSAVVQSVKDVHDAVVAHEAADTKAILDARDARDVAAYREGENRAGP